MIREPLIQRDGFVALAGGVDTSKSPSIIDRNHAAFAGNVAFRGGFPITRPSFQQLPIACPTVEISNWIDSNVLQEAVVYQRMDGRGEIVASIGGRIFAMLVGTYEVREITPTKITATTLNFLIPGAPPATVVVQVVDGTDVRVGYPLFIQGVTYIVVSKSGSSLTLQAPTPPVPAVVLAGTAVTFLDPNSNVLGKAWMEQAEIFLIIQDDQSRAIIYDGTRVFRSDIKKQQVPTGSAMIYGIGRLWVVVNGNQFAAGDIVRGPNGTEEYNFLDALLSFTENTFLTGGGNFSVPFSAGRINALQFIPVLDSSTGNGPLMVFTENGTFSVNAPADRESWQDVRSPIQTVVGTSLGALSYAIKGPNGDIFYRSQDGVRSLMLALRQFALNDWGNIPISAEMDRVLKNDDPTLLKYSSAIIFDNRLLFTVVPQPTRYAAYHLGIGSLDFHPLFSMRLKSPPAYDGIWTGIHVTKLFKGLVNGTERAFAFVYNADGKNELWEIKSTGSFDNTDGRISSFIETKGFFGSNPMELKRLETLEIFIDEVQGVVDFTVFYKPDQYPCWFQWGIGETECSEYRTCSTTDHVCGIPVVKRPTYKTRINFGQPPDVDTDIDGKPARLGYEHQIRIEWVGKCRIRKVIVRMTPMPEEAGPPVV